MNISLRRRSADEIAQRVVQDIPEGAHVNLGIGMPMKISNHLPKDREILLQSENGLLGMGPLAAPHEVDTELVNAGKQPVTMLPGASLFNHAESFAMIRGGHIDICVLGAFEVSVNGDLANWRTNRDDAIPAVGGAMDLAYGAKRLYVMMDHQTKDGRSKIVTTCSYPLTARSVVDNIYTDLATLMIQSDGIRAVDWINDLEFEQLCDLTGVKLLPPKD
jgi:3-oxoadipate CoA-transferase beta subunit